MRVYLRLVLTGWLILTAGVAAAERTDVIVLWNGNTITGEVKGLQQGKLEFKTDHAGTIYIEWEFVHGLTASGIFDVETQLGVHHYGTLSKAEESHFLVVTPATGLPVVLDMNPDVVLLGHALQDRLSGGIAQPGFAVDRDRPW